MDYIVDEKQMQQIDRYTIEQIGIPALVLMEKAAEAVAEQVKYLIAKLSVKKETARILAVYGTGGNGGDAIAAARLLHLEGYCVNLYAADNSAQLCETAAAELKIAKNCSVPEVSGTDKELDFASYHILVDGIFGVGLSRTIEGKYRDLIERINASKAKILAVDIPSGVHAGTGRCLGVCVQADCTVTFGARKVGQLLYPGAEYCGRLVCTDIVFPPFVIEKVVKKLEYAYFTYTKKDIDQLPPRKQYSNKGTYGKVLVFAGSKEVFGAAYLSACAAYKCGVGLVKLVSARECIEMVGKMLPEALMQAIPENGGDKDFWNLQIDWADAVLAGPGIGTKDMAKNALTNLIAALKDRQKPFILDADALNLLAMWLDGTWNGFDQSAVPFKEDDNFIKNKKQEEFPLRERLAKLCALLPEKTVLTPHIKELSRLTKKPVSQIVEDFVDTAKQCLYNRELIYVLKDARTIVVGDGEIYINTSGNSGMATGGSGDVLAGMIAGLSVGVGTLKAARLSVYLHGLAGDKAAEEYGERGMLAGDILRAFYW